MARHPIKSSIRCQCGGHYLETNKGNHVRSQLHVYYLLYNNQCTTKEFSEFVTILYKRRPRRTVFEMT